jgi:ribonucleotide monophosphatase NagD (HAD superfamily)
MLGDDLEPDINPAHEMGSKAILILTGKTQLPLPLDCKTAPDFIANNLSEVEEILQKFYSLS